VKTSAFEYIAPESCDEALEAIAGHGDDAAVLAGGQSLIPMMNLRIAAGSGRGPAAGLAC
jgi:CO/xanthine dehydrogenase FAD-binding subunit